MIWNGVWTTDLVWNNQTALRNLFTSLPLPTWSAFFFFFSFSFPRTQWRTMFKIKSHFATEVLHVPLMGSDALASSHTVKHLFFWQCWKYLACLGLRRDARTLIVKAADSFSNLFPPDVISQATKTKPSYCKLWSAHRSHCYLHSYVSRRIYCIRWSNMKTKIINVVLGQMGGIYMNGVN